MPRTYIQHNWQQYYLEFLEYENESITDFLKTKGLKNPNNYQRHYAGWHEAREKFLQKRIEAKEKQIIKSDEERTDLYGKLIKAILQQEALLLKSNIKYDTEGKPVVKNALVPNIASQVIERCLKCDRLMSGQSTENIATNFHSAITELLNKTARGEIIDIKPEDIDKLPMAGVKLKNELSRDKQDIPEQVNPVTNPIQDKD